MMQNTFQGSYVKVFTTDITGIIANGDQTQVLDGVTAGYSYDQHDRPLHSYPIGPEWNRATGYVVTSDGTANKTGALKVWGYAQNGPAELIGDISFTLGTAHVTEVTSCLVADTLTIVANPGGLTCQDNTADNRIAKFTFDNYGYKWLFFEPYEISATSVAFVGAGVNVYLRPF
jgi:hypothetical protein